MLQKRSKLSKPSFDKPQDDIKVHRANQYPIENLYSGQLKRTGKVLMGCCPFHQETIPSFAIYEDNTYFCFAGCGGGDAIDFYKKLHQVDFQIALEALAR